MRVMTRLRNRCAAWMECSRQLFDCRSKQGREPRVLVQNHLQMLGGSASITSGEGDGSGVIPQQRIARTKAQCQGRLLRRFRQLPSAEQVPRQHVVTEDAG